MGRAWAGQELGGGPQGKGRGGHLSDSQQWRSFIENTQVRSQPEGAWLCPVACGHVAEPLGLYPCVWLLPAAVRNPPLPRHPRAALFPQDLLPPEGGGPAMSAGGAGDGRWDGSGAGAPSGPPLREADGSPPDAATSMFTVPCVRASVLPFLGSPSPGPASPPPPSALQPSPRPVVSAVVFSGQVSCSLSSPTLCPWLSPLAA